MCHCGFSAAARPSRGIRWAGPCSVQCGGCGRGQASQDERSRCENVGREERRWRGTESEGEGVALL
jgi:hypothetical protein